MTNNEQRLTLEDIINKYGLTLWSTANTAQGKSYQYMDYDGINVIINEWDKSFQLKWLVPKSIFTIECPTCSPYDYPNHFDRTYKRFQDVVTVYKCGLNYMWGLNYAYNCSSTKREARVLSCSNSIFMWCLF